jgi:hypothetical protein
LGRLGAILDVGRKRIAFANIPGDRPRAGKVNLKGHMMFNLIQYLIGEDPVSDNPVSMYAGSAEMQPHFDQKHTDEFLEQHLLSRSSLIFDFGVCNDNNENPMLD